MTAINNAEELEAQEDRYRKALSALEITFGVLFGLGILSAIGENRPDFRVSYYAVGLPLFLLLLVCGFGMHSTKRPIWPVWLSWVFGVWLVFTSIVGSIVAVGVIHRQRFKALGVFSIIVGMMLILSLGVSILVLNYEISRLASARSNHQGPSFDEDSGLIDSTMDAPTDDD